MCASSGRQGWEGRREEEGQGGGGGGGQEEQPGPGLSNADRLNSRHCGAPIIAQEYPWGRGRKGGGRILNGVMHARMQEPEKTMSISIKKCSFIPRALLVDYCHSRTLTNVCQEETSTLYIEAYFHFPFFSLSN